MFVCHGNICRSPMAEFIFKDMLENADVKKNLSFLLQQVPKKYGTESAILYIRPQKQNLQRKHGISCKEKRAVQLKKSDYDKYDLFLYMDSRNVTNTIRIFGSDPYNKVRKLLEPVQYLNVCGFSSIILLKSRKKFAGILPYGKNF